MSYKPIMDEEALWVAHDALEAQIEEQRGQIEYGIAFPEDFTYTITWQTQALKRIRALIRKLPNGS